VWVIPTVDPFALERRKASAVCVSAHSLVFTLSGLFKCCLYISYLSVVTARKFSE
jgi:hypothetical protein